MTETIPRKRGYKVNPLALSSSGGSKTLLRGFSSTSGPFFPSASSTKR